MNSIPADAAGKRATCYTGTGKHPDHKFKCVNGLTKCYTLDCDIKNQNCTSVYPLVAFFI